MSIRGQRPRLQYWRISLAIDIPSVANPDNANDKLVVFNGIEDAIVALPEAVPPASCGLRSRQDGGDTLVSQAAHLLF